ncbi:uncharacterized protein [Dysidea avara]|uniref:uncharacterized protein n=1 Tax=Dysidea avara TaxID=196820 RepID=UPI003324C406
MISAANVRLFQSIKFFAITIVFTLLALFSYHYYYSSNLSVNVADQRVIQRTANAVQSRLVSHKVSNHDEVPEYLTVKGLQCNLPSYYTPDIVEHLDVLWKYLEGYAAFHNKGVRLLKDGQSDRVRTLTWYCGLDFCSGLGWRFRGFMVNLIYAALTDRVLLLKWNKPSAESVYLEPNMISWQFSDYLLSGSFVDLGIFKRADIANVTTSNHIIETLVGGTNHVQMLYNSVIRQDALLEILAAKLSDQHKLKVITEFRGVLQNNGYEILQSFAFSFLFKLSNNLQTFASSIRNKLNLDKIKYVALHIRTGEVDNLRKAVKRFQEKDSMQLSAARCAIKQADKYIGPNGIVVVVSDSTDVKRTLAKEFPRIRFLDNVIVHVDLVKDLSEDAMLGIWQDIILLAESYILVQQRSSFAELAANICQIPESRIKSSSKCKL